MMMHMICPYIFAGIVVVLTIMWFVDRAAKKKGHQMRDPGQMGRLASEAQQDGRAVASNPVVGTGDISWTGYSRHNSGQGERSIRENDERDDPHLKSTPPPDSPVVED